MSLHSGNSGTWRCASHANGYEMIAFGLRAVECVCPTVHAFAAWRVTKCRAGHPTAYDRAASAHSASPPSHLHIRRPYGDPTDYHEPRLPVIVTANAGLKATPGIVCNPDRSPPVAHQPCDQHPAKPVLTRGAPVIRIRRGQGLRTLHRTFGAGRSAVR